MSENPKTIIDDGLEEEMKRQAAIIEQEQARNHIRGSDKQPETAEKAGEPQKPTDASSQPPAAKGREEGIGGPW